MFLPVSCFPPPPSLPKSVETRKSDAKNRLPRKRGLGCAHTRVLPCHSRESGKGSQTRYVAFGVPNPSAPWLSWTPACAGVTKAGIHPALILSGVLRRMPSPRTLLPAQAEAFLSMSPRRPARIGRQSLCRRRVAASRSQALGMDGSTLIRGRSPSQAGHHQASPRRRCAAGLEAATRRVLPHQPPSQRRRVPRRVPVWLSPGIVPGAPGIPWVP